MAERKTTWKSVRDRVRDDILAGRFKPGDRLPRDADFADTLNCARSTVQRAMQDLVDSGLIERRRKGGTHVRREPIARATLDIRVTRLEIEQSGREYGYQLISLKEAVPPVSVLAKLGIAAPRPLLRADALHLADGRPYILEERWICTQTTPEILQVDLTRISANEWLIKNKPYSRYELRLYAQKASATTAQQMEIDQGDALFVIERATFEDERPITLVKSFAQPGYQLVATT
ncbi:GntR family transcriptional regulator [Ruegeria arenilitoris]|uniref:GntR family transcriptional regulator n=1 Tax=Ruegeria arenilitoris TaxID=1173585 RepID=UPI0034643DC8